jgi:hypothetical protein
MANQSVGTAWAVIAVVVALVAFSHQQDTIKYPKFDPCTPYDEEAVNKGDEYVIGLAYYPGGEWADWNVTKPGDTRGIPALNPCLGDVYYNGTGNDTANAISGTGKVGNYNQILRERGVVFASFTAQTDNMASLNIPAEELRNLLNRARPAGVVSVAAFRGNITSPPMFVASKSAELTGAAGVVTKLGLTIAMDRGILLPGGLQWFNFDGCKSCGKNETECISYTLPTSYATYTQESCAQPYPCETANCTTSILATFQGNSKSGQPLQSSQYLTSAYQYSITNVFSDILNNLDNSLINEQSK